MHEPIDELVNKKSIQKCTTSDANSSHAEAWRKSNLSQSEYCKQHNITLYKLNKLVHLDNNHKQQPFKKIATSSASAALVQQPPMIEILVDSRVKIRLPEAISPQFIVYVVKELIK